MEDADAARAFGELERLGILLLQDARLASLATLIAGEPIRGSWWGHAAGSRIFHAAGALDHHSDVATFKLVDGKVCFVHRRLWPALYAIGTAGEPWQLERLDAAARDLWQRVEREGSVRASGKPAKALEQRLLAVSRQVHTESGAHASELSSWKRFAEEKGLSSGRRTAAEAKEEIENTVRAMAEGTAAKPKFPWPR